MPPKLKEHSMGQNSVRLSGGGRFGISHKQVHQVKLKYERKGWSKETARQMQVIVELSEKVVTAVLVFAHHPVKLVVRLVLFRNSQLFHLH